MTIKTEMKTTAEVEIPIPLFLASKDQRHWLAVLDENTVVAMYVGSSHTNISNGTPDLYKNDIANAWSEFHGCTEMEFLEKYDAVISSISLHPKLAV